MTTRPEFRIGTHLIPGLIAIALFLVMTAIALGSQFPAAAGFEAGSHITASIGYALFNIDAGDVPAEGFLAAFLIIAIVLDAALDGAVMLARRDEPRSADIDADRSATAVETGGDD